MDIIYFPSPNDLRKWLKVNQAEHSELWIGFYKKGSGKPSVTYSEALDEALCFGWIDGVRKSVDADAYCPLHTAKAAEQMERGEHPARAKTYGRGPHALRPESV